MGFDYQHIPNIESLPWEYFCSVCQLLINPNEALQSMCGHLYCQPCFAYVASTTMTCPYDGYLVSQTDAKPLMESNKVLADTIGKTVVYCPYGISGCPWLGSLSDSSLHCSGCAFGNSLVICSWCGIQIAHRKWVEHAQSCLEMQQVQMHAYMGASVASQPNDQGHGVAAATLTQEQWYQQPCQLYYGNGYYMHQQPLHLPSLAPQHHVNVQPAVHYVAQTHSQMQAQPQLQSQSSVLHQPHTVFPSFPSAPHLEVASVPQAYPSVPPHLQHPSLAFPVSQGLQDLQAQAHFQTAPFSQAHYLQNAQVPQHQQFYGKNRSLPQNTICQSQSNQPHAYWTGQKMYHQPHQTNQLGAPPHNMPVYHQVGTQTPQVQNHFPQQVSHVHPPQSLPTVPKQESSLPSQLTRDQYTKELVPEYGEAPVPESSYMYSSQQPLPKPSLPHQHATPPKTDVVQNQTHQVSPFYNPHIALQSHLSPIGLQKYQHTLHVQQPITPILVNSVRASNVGSGQAPPSLPAVKEVDIQRTQNQVPQASWGDNIALNHIVGKQGDEAILDGSEARSSTSGSTNTVYGVNRAVEVATNNDHELKGKCFDACAESSHRPNIPVEGNETKSGPLGEQVMKENVLNDRKKLRKGLLVERKGTDDSLSLIRQHYLTTSPLQSEDTEGSGAYSSGSLDRGFDKRSSVRPHGKQEPDLELRPASRFSQPSIDLGERQFRRGPRSPISEHLGMPSHEYIPLDHGLGGSRAETSNTEGRNRFGLLSSEFKGHGNLGEKVQDADMSGPVDSNGLSPGDVGFRNRFTVQRSLPECCFPNFRKRATTEPVEGLDFHSHAKEHQPKSMDAKKLKTAPTVSSPVCNQNKNEERRSGGLG